MKNVGCRPAVVSLRGCVVIDSYNTAVACAVAVCRRHAGPARRPHRTALGTILPEDHVELLRCAAIVATIAGLPIGAAASAADSDRATVVAIVRDSVGEMQLCELAFTKSQNADVRTFCRRTVNIHARIAISAMQLAQKIGATDATLQASPATSDELDRLSKQPASDFDRSLMIEEIENHEDEQDLLKYASAVTDDLTVKRYEQRLLPDVERSLGLAEVTLNTIGRDQP